MNLVYLDILMNEFQGLIKSAWGTRFPQINKIQPSR
jgi:hypothetical protein